MTEINTTDTCLTWGWRIKKAGETQKTVATALGINQQLLSNYCTGKTKPQTHYFDKIENYLRSKGV